MSIRVVIQHIAGSKSNQVEQFPLASLAEMTLGRDPASTIAFDPQRDDAVSRQHAVIKIEHGETPSFRITDLGSRNGTKVNGQRIAGEMELLPGDTVELGTGGPKFSFDLQPRPARLVARTRVIDIGMTTPTRVIDTKDIHAAAMAATSGDAPAKRGVGRETVVGMLAAQRQHTNRLWMYVLAGVLVLVGCGGAGLYYYNKMKLAQQAAAASAALEIQKRALEAQKAEAARQLASTASTLQSEVGMSSQQIMQKYGNATVLVHLEWRAYDKATGKPLFQKVMTNKEGRFLCYVKLGDAVVRWLTTDDNNHQNQEIKGEGTGSGFVISGQGFIMTNKHVAAGWEVPYITFEEVSASTLGLLFDINNLKKPPVPFQLGAEPGIRKKLIGWTPAEGAIVFRSDIPIPVNPHTKDGYEFQEIDGRMDLMQVQFPGSVTPLSAHLESVSSLADVAVIKVDAQQALTTVALAQDDQVQVGEKVTVLGYPYFTPQTKAVMTTIQGGQEHTVEQVVPEPTVTEGLISQKSPAIHEQGQGIITGGEMGDAYQLTVPTSHGNSGGPVFDATGKVIGLFTYGRSDLQAVTYAVPIKYGRDLLQVQRSN